jgi:hypothetical protein
MSNGAFRDASAAIERAAMLEQENEELRKELADMAKLRIEVEELEHLRTEVEALRAIARSENEGAFMRRLLDERDELDREVKTLRERLGKSESELVRLKLKNRFGLETVIEQAFDLFRKK